MAPSEVHPPRSSVTVCAVDPLSPGEVAALAAVAGHPLPPERVEPAGEAFAEVLALAETLDDLPLEGVEPVLGQRP